MAAPARNGPASPPRPKRSEYTALAATSSTPRKRSPTSVSPTVKVAPIDPPQATTTVHSASAAGDDHGPAAPGSSHGKIAIAAVATATQPTSSQPRSMRSASQPAGYWKKIAPTAPTQMTA